MAEIKARSPRMRSILEGLNPTKVEETTGIKFEVVGPYEEGSETLTRLHNAGAKMQRVGPYTDAEWHPKMDMNRFLFTGFLPAQEASE